MALLCLYLSYIILVLLLVIYFKLVYKCKRGVEVVVDVVRKSDDTKDKNSVKSLKVDVLPQPPGPIPWPVIGNLALLGKYAVPFEGFSALSKIYGDVYSLTLGTTRCVVVNNLDIIKEVLNQNGKYFGGRPNFEVRIISAKKDKFLIENAKD
jgi:cytochrome P450 family 307 subfamily A